MTKSLVPDTREAETGIAWAQDFEAVMHYDYISTIVPRYTQGIGSRSSNQILCILKSHSLLYTTHVYKKSALLYVWYSWEYFIFNLSLILDGEPADMEGQLYFLEKIYI